MSNSVVQRWKDNNYACPPYQYDYNNLIISLDDSNTQMANTASIDVREKLLMYPPGITREVLPIKHRVNNKRYKELRIAWLLN